MRKLLFLLSLILICSCSDDLMTETAESKMEVGSRAASGDSYYFEKIQGGDINDIEIDGDSIYKYDCGSIYSYKENGDTIIDIDPIVLSSPDWVNVGFWHVYYKSYVIFMNVQKGTDKPRTGVVTIKQPESDKTLSFNITQDSYYNNADIAVNCLSLGKFEITVTTQYPAKEGTVFTFNYTTFNGEEYKDYFNLLTFKQDATTASLVVDHSSDIINYGYLGLCLNEVGCTPSDKYHYVTNITTTGYIYH